MADATTSTDQKSSNLDPTALNEIASNGQFANQQIGEVTKAIGGLANIVLPATKGGTGISSYTIGDLLYADTATSLAKLSDVATGNALISGGIGGVPSWGKVTPSHFSGVLPVANGGTNRNSLTNHAVVLGATTSSVNFATPSTAGQPLLSNGASSDPSFQGWVDGIGGLFLFPQNGTYTVWLATPFSMTLTSFVGICGSGSCTATLAVNATPVGNGALSIATSGGSNALSAPNTLNVGSSVNVTISSNASCQNMSFMITYTRP